MYLTFTSQASAAKTITLAYPADFEGTGHYEQRDTPIAEIWGKFNISDLWFEGVCICHTSIKPKLPCNINLQCDSFCWIMNFILEGELNARFDGTKQLSLKDGRQHTFFTQLLNTDLVFEQPANIFTICLTRKFISKLIGKEILKDALDTNAGKTFTLVTKGNYRHTRLHAIIKEIMEAEQTGYIAGSSWNRRSWNYFPCNYNRPKSAKYQPKGLTVKILPACRKQRPISIKTCKRPAHLLSLPAKPD